MLPEILTLKSFLSYREKQVLDFTKFHVALISGENGNGKSSILDAVTFALFSMARGVEGNKKGLGDLVSNGDSFLSVSLQFVQDGSRFRIMRTYDKIKRSSNMLLQLEKDGDFVNISESTIRETNKKIEDIIHMNYETFITSSFVMQGRSDYFTAKNPTERIEILREMLNLNIYEKAREKVKEKLREAEFEIKELSKRVLDGKEEIKKMPEIKALLKEKEEKIKEIRLKIDKFNKEIESIRKSLRDRDKLQNDRKHIEEEIYKFEDDFKLKLKFEAGFRETFERINEILSREKEIRESYVELATVKKSYEEMLEKSAKFQQLVNEKNKIISSVEKTISVKKERVNSLKKSLKEFEASIKDVTSKIKSEEILVKDGLENLEKLKEESKRLAENLDEVNIKNEEILKQIKEKEKLELRLKEIKHTKDERIKSINQQIREKEESLKAVKKKIDDINYKALEPLLREKEDNYNTLKSLLEIYEGQSKKLTDKGNFLNIDIKNLEQAINELNEKLDLISQESEDKCPLCGSPLSLEHREEIKNNYKAELEKNCGKVTLKKEILSKVKEEIASLKVIKREEVEFAFKKLEETHSEISKRKSIREEFESQKANLEGELLKFKDMIEKRVLSEAELDEFKNVTANLEKLIDVEDKLEKITAETDKLKKEIEILNKKINEQNLNISIHRTNVINLNKSLTGYRQKKEDIHKEISDIESLLSGEEFMKDEYQKISDLEKAIFDVQFNAELLEKLKVRKSVLSKYENEFIELNGASIKREDVLKNLARLAEEKVELQKLKFDRSEKLLSIDHELEKFKGIDDNLGNIKKDLETTNKYLETLLDEKVRLEEQYKKLIELKEAVSESEKKIKECKGEKSVLNVCDDMFGKEGIPVAVIRSVLPEIEMFSNDLLLRMTNGNMQIKFTTLKSGKSGDKNTFDIEVYDRGQRRRYELFSGGEQFRINLAIRIGISLFLSSLSGATLEMLVIDEGLGSQDESGKERIIKEISAIKDKFKKILVVTHIGDIKESFEYEIHVVKDSYTSRLYVV